MSIELSILKLFCDDREVEARNHGYIDALNNLEPEVRLLFTLVHNYYTEDWDGPISKKELTSYYLLKHPNVKAKDIHLDLIAQIFVSNVSIDLLRAHLDHLIEKHAATQIINKLIPVMEGDKYGILEGVSVDISKFTELLHNPPLGLVVPTPCTLSVEELIEQEIEDGGLPWHLAELTDIIGGCRRKTLGLIYAFVDCYSDDTEVLSSSGWKLFRDLTPKDKVAQYRDDTLVEFVAPLNYYSKKYIGPMYHLHDTIGRYDQLVTPTHRIIYRRSGMIQETLAKDIRPNQTQQFDKCGIGKEGKHLSWFERFLIAYQADGSSWREGCDGSKCGHFTVRFKFVKERKINRFLNILKYSGLNYTQKGGKFRVQVAEKISKTFDWVNLNRVSGTWCCEFIEELSHWDSTTTPNHDIVTYSSKHKLNVDVVQALCVLANRVTKYHLQPKTKNHHSNQHRLSIRPNQPSNGASIIKEKIDYDGTVYCVQVPSGMLIVRRNNQPCVSGNSGKTSFAMASCANFARRLVGTGELICYCGNEESAERLRLRLVQAFTQWTKHQIQKNGGGAAKLAVEGGLDNVKIFDNITSSEQIEYILKEYKPHILYIDQGTGVEFASKKKLEGVGALEVLFKWYRKLCITHNVGIIGIAQGDKKAEDMKWLKLSDIYGAKVVIQGALDYAIGIGRKVNNPIDEALRYVHIPKNKLAGGDDGRFAVHFDKYNCSWEVN